MDEQTSLAYTDPELAKRKAEENRLRIIFDRISVKRSLLAKGKIRLPGYIFYNISFKDFSGAHYSQSRLVDLEKENQLGEETVVENIKKELAASHFPAGDLHEFEFLHG